MLVHPTFEGEEVEKSGKKTEKMQEVNEIERKPRECGVSRIQENKYFKKENVFNQCLKFLRNDH